MMMMMMMMITIISLSLSSLLFHYKVPFSNSSRAVWTEHKSNKQISPWKLSSCFCCCPWKFLFFRVPGLLTTWRPL